MPIHKTFLFLLFCIAGLSAYGTSSPREKFNFNSDWLITIGDIANGENPGLDDSGWKRVTLPHAFNEDEAFRLNIANLTDTISWYRKHFKVPNIENKKIFVEFEGLRQGADFYLNGEYLGLHENGVMAVGYDLTPYIKEGENVLAVRIDNDWTYEERNTGTNFQWNDRNFNANYGGIPKNVWLHVTPMVYQTLPLYSSLKTTGVYVYASDIDIDDKKATITAESEVKNETNKPVTLSYKVTVRDADGKEIKTFS